MSLHNLELEGSHSNVNPKGGKDERRRKSSILSIPAGFPTAEQLNSLNTVTLLDSFYCLYVRIGTQWTLVHVSEVIHSNTCPQFRRMSLPKLPRDSTHLEIKVWVRQQNNPWRLFLQVKTSTGTLYAVDTVSEQKNRLVLNFCGKLYSTQPRRKSEANGDPKPRKSSYTYDAARSITKLDGSVAELAISKLALSKSIDESVHWLLDQQNINNIPYTTDKLKRLIRQLEESVRRQRSQNDSILHEIMHHKVAIDDIQQLIDDKFPDIVNATSNQIEMTEQECLPLQETLADQVFPEISAKVFCHASLLLQIIPIENLEGSVKFSVIGIEFPATIHELLNVCYDTATENHTLLAEINAGLSYIIQLVNALADVLCVRLAYKMSPQGSESSIYDIYGKCFTLFYDPKVSKNGHNEEFERALHLLNQNLQHLIHATTIQLKSLNPQAVSHPIPPDSWDNLLWRLQWLVLMVTAIS